MRCNGVNGGTSAIFERSSFALGMNALLLHKRSQTTLQAAATDDVSQYGMQVVDADAIRVPGNLVLNPCSQILGSG